MDENYPQRSNYPLWVGFILTCIWFVGCGTYAARNFSSISELAANNLGDFLGGIFSPLALLWLIVTVLLQKQELQAQREELELNRQVLKLQAEELRNSAEQLQTQAQILEKQFQSQNKQKALNDIYEGIHGVCSVIISKFSSSRINVTSGGIHEIGSWIADTGLKELLEQEAYTFLLDELISRMRKTTKRIEKLADKDIAVRIVKIPSLDEMTRILSQIEKLLTIPSRENAQELDARFESDLPVPELRSEITKIKNLCRELNLVS